MIISENEIINAKEKLLDDIEYAIQQFRKSTDNYLTYSDGARIIDECIDAFLPRREDDNQ